MNTRWSTTRQPTRRPVPRIDVLSVMNEPMTAKEIAYKLRYSDCSARRELNRLEITGAVRGSVVKRFGENPTTVWEKV